MAVSFAQLSALALTLHDMERQASAGQDEAFRFTEVQDDEEFLRIMNIPRRPIPDVNSLETEGVIDALMSAFYEGAKPFPGRLFGTQAVALQEAWEAGGGVGMLRVGAGKTGVAALLPEVWSSERPLLITKSKLIPEMRAYIGKMRASGWKLRPDHEYMMLGYEVLSSPNSGELRDKDGNTVRKSILERLNPTDIICDEAHKLGAAGTTGTKRVNAFLKAHPDVRRWFMTGTFFRKSIEDAEHILRWALGANAPLPHEYKSKKTWGSYLDAKPGKSGSRSGVGALVNLLSPEERAVYDAQETDDDKRSIIRGAVATRLLQTKGVVGTQDPPIDIGLSIETVLPSDECPDIEEAYRQLRGDPKDPIGFPGWELPDGTQIPDPSAFARNDYTYGLGFWQKDDPAGSDMYRLRRNNWHAWCRRAIKVNRSGIDSEALCKGAVRRGAFDDKWTDSEKDIPGCRPGVSRLELWEEEVRKYRKEHPGLLAPPSVSQWISLQVVYEVSKWIDEHKEGVIWVHHIGLGEKLHEELQIPYYHEGGLDSRGNHIERHKCGPAVASFASNGTGRNLQGIWHKNLWLWPPEEQSLGRTHRTGQTKSVENYLYIGCQRHLISFFSAQKHTAKFSEEMERAPKRLRYASTNLVSTKQLEGRPGLRWAAPPKTRKDT